MRHTCLRRLLLLALPGLLLTGVPVRAQQQQPPLAEVARVEAARRKTVTTEPGRRYTNANLIGNRERTEPASGQPAPAEGGATPAAGAPAAGGGEAKATPPAEPEAKKDDPKKDQAYWRERMTTARQQLERTQMFALALESRVNGLWADFTARDDPAQRGMVEQDRQKAIAELERVKQEVETQTKALAAIEDEARRLGVPPGWLR